MPIKAAMIGAGSIGFTRRLMHDILAVPELRDAEFAFMDINRRNLDMIFQLAQRDIRENGLPAKVSATLDQREAIASADYVFCMVRVGGLDAFQYDIDIPLRYGVDQCVGDTLAPGGIMYAQRGIPVILSICKDIREAAKPDCVFMNYSNPMAMLTWAATQYGGVKTIGLCHGVEHSCMLIAEALHIPENELDFIFGGINHQTWCLSVKHKGREMKDKLLAAIEKHPVFNQHEKCRIDVLRRFGYWSTESNGHLSEYLPWYRKRPEEIKHWIDLSRWNNGETGGYLRVCTEGRNWFKHDYPQWLKQEAPRITPDIRSRERGSYIVEAMETGRVFRSFFNMVNHHHITNLPPDCIIEASGHVDRAGVNIMELGDLPLACAATCNASISVQRMAVEAAVHGDVMLLKQAMLHDPLTAAVCNPPEIWQLADAMLVAQAQWLPQYKNEIAKAKKRLASEKNLGAKSVAGAARLKTKSIAEIKAERESAAVDSSKQVADKSGKKSRGKKEIQ